MRAEMKVPVPTLSVCVGKDFACVKVFGRANFNVSLDFKTVLNELHRKGFNHFYIDLSECILMDSTFLGVLTGFGISMTQPNGASGGHPLELLGVTPRINELLENLGVLNLFKVCLEGLPETGTVASTTPTSVNPSREEVTRTCLEAHKTLMAANPDNINRFKDVTRFLAEDLKKLEQRQG
jgi:anti-sigma B factor antagonist